MEVLAPKNLIQQVAEGEYVVSVVSGYGAEITWSRRRKRKRNGGGGGGRISDSGSAGGSGIIIIRYPV